jgi:D(-)-tartrate dehydratase
MRLRLSASGWFEDVCDPLDFETLSAVSRRYAAPIAAGEALFSAAEANLLDRHGGLRRDRDILLFDPVHCYGLPGYLQIVEVLKSAAGRVRRSGRMAAISSACTS